MMRTANPALNAKTFVGLRPYEAETAMTIQGAVNKTAILLLLALVSASYTWKLFFNAWDPAVVTPWMIGGALGIGFSLFVVVIAALNLVLDFDFIENGAAQGAPKYMEWYAAFGLMVTLVWLYIEILRLLAKLADRR